MEGRCINTCRSAIRIRKYAHNQGVDCHRSDRKLPLPLPSHARIVYLDDRKITWCSFDSAAFHSCVWPRSGRMAKSIVRAMRTNHCKWMDILAIRGRCFGGRKVCAKSNQILDFLWSWVCERRPFILYREGHDNHLGPPHWAEICSGGPVPDWLNECYGEDEYDDYCQWNLLGRRGLHRPGKLYSNLWKLDPWSGLMYRNQRPGNGPEVKRCWCSRVMCHYQRAHNE